MRPAFSRSLVHRRRSGMSKVCRVLPWQLVSVPKTAYCVALSLSQARALLPVPLGSVEVQCGTHPTGRLLRDGEHRSPSGVTGVAPVGFALEHIDYAPNLEADQLLWCRALLVFWSTSCGDH